MPYVAAVITCSDRAHSGEYEDRSGPIIAEGLVQAGFVVGDHTVVPDDRAAIAVAIRDAVAGGARVVVTTGGTGVAPRDVTVEATREVIAYELPGVADAIRRAGATPMAMLSRGIAGVIDEATGVRAVVVNAPGSTGGARDTVATLAPVLEHLIGQLDGATH